MKMYNKINNTTKKIKYWFKESQSQQNEMKTMIDLSEPPVEAKAKSDWENPDRVKQKNTWGDEHLTLLVDICDDDGGDDTGDNVFYPLIQLMYYSPSH